MKFSAIILAGGLSHRMGSNKALIPYRGKPLIQYAVEVAQAVTNDILISANSRDLDHLGFPVVPDLLAVQAPLAGIHAGLSASNTAWNLILTCDMPGITTVLIERMVTLLDDEVRIVVPEHHGFIEPLCGFYHRSLLQTIESNLKSGKMSPLDLIRESTSRFLSLHSDEEITEPHLFRNINRPEDLK